MRNKYKKYEHIITSPMDIKTIYYIHENTAPVKIQDHWVQVVTGYVVAKGYMIDGDFRNIYHDSGCIGTTSNHIPGLVWDNYESGLKQLAKLIGQVQYNYSTNIKETFDTLKEKYPEMMI